MNFNISAAAAVNIAQIALSTSQDDFLRIVKDLASGDYSSITPSDQYVSENIDVDTNSRYQAVENAQLGVNVTQIADGALSDVSVMLNRIQELSTQASSDIYSDEQRMAMQAEVDQIAAEITKSLGSTKYNNKDLINVVGADGKTSEKISFQVGTDSLPSSMITYDPNIKMDEIKFDLSSAENARASIAKAEGMLKNVAAKRAEIATVQTGLINSVESNMTAIINNQSASSTISDTDYASSMLGLVQNQMSQESLVAVLSSTLKSQGTLLDLISGISA